MFVYAYYCTDCRQPRHRGSSRQRVHRLPSRQIRREEHNGARRWASPVGGKPLALAGPNDMYVGRENGHLHRKVLSLLLNVLTVTTSHLRTLNSSKYFNLLRIYRSKKENLRLYSEHKVFWGSTIEHDYFCERVPCAHTHAHTRCN